MKGQKYIAEKFKFFQRNMLRKFWLDFPDQIQIQTHTVCNAHCNFCPYPETSKTNSHGKMDLDLFKKIINETVNYKVSTIYPFLMNEPLLDKDLPDKINYIKEVNKRVRVAITSNGSLLTKEMADKLSQSKLDELVISINTMDKVLYNKVMGLDLDKTVNNVLYFLENLKKNNSRMSVRMSVVRTSETDDFIRKTIDFWNQHGINVFVNDIENRGGNVILFTNLKIGQKIKKKIRSFFLKNVNVCMRPLVQAYILYNGDMILCCADWKREVVLGNVFDESVYDVWNSPKSTAIRKLVLEKQFSKMKLCSTCSYAGV